MRVKNKLSMALAVLVVSAGIAVVSDAPAYASTVICSATATEYAAGGEPIRVPAVGTAAGSSSSCSLFQGDQSDAVRTLQYDLNSCYPNTLFKAIWPIAADGIFGPNTKTALKAVQAYVGIPVADRDGSYGPQTKAALSFYDETGGVCAKWVRD